MTSEIRDSTEEERGMARKVSSEVPSHQKDLVKKIEDEGFGVIYEAGDVENILILTPYGITVKWDFQSRSLDELLGKIPDKKLMDISIYAGLACSIYKGKRSLLFPNLRL